MKNIKIIPLLSLTSLLASCGIGTGKAPSFSKEGDEVSYSEFQSAITEACEDSELYDEDAIYGDRFNKMSYYESTIETQKRDKTELSKSERVRSAKGEEQFDADNYVAKATAEVKISYKTKTLEANSNVDGNQKTELYYQFGKVDGTTYLLAANPKTKEYSTEATAQSNKRTTFNRFIASEISSLVLTFSNYLPSGSTGSGDYKYYVNGNTLFTYIATIDKDDNVASATRTTKSRIKVQLDLSNKKQALRASYEESIKVTYTEDYNGIAKGDVVNTENIVYIDYSSTSKNIDLNELDISEYKNNPYGSSNYFLYY